MTKTFILQNQEIQISFLKFVVYDLSGKLFKFWIYVSQTCLTAWNQWKTAASQNVSACSISKNINDFILFHLCFNSSFLFLFTVPVFPPVIGKLSCWTHAPINHNCPYGFMWAVWGQKNGKLLWCKKVVCTKCQGRRPVSEFLEWKCECMFLRACCEQEVATNTQPAKVK